ncbi:hypothetical protein [Staphylococcus ratti]|uniref:Uncharacterized protein n=1 Tax=Staphylococcus ratti TaxID=2892440 RepID=A0ABY3PFW9_9STAP|nr:hypothetical protein [Staphylococcus ratti]UEX91212.1 hypothetical protein LN051_11400 [Staphylococcus ratti]
MEKLIHKKILFPLLALILSITAIASPHTTEAKETKGITDKQIKIIQKSLKYDPQNKKYVFDEKYAKQNGLTKNQATNLKTFFENMNDKQIKEFNKKVGFKPDYKNNQPTPRIAPALLYVLSFIGGAVAGKLLDEIMNYGITKTCKAHKGKWPAFDDYCSTNGHI